MEIDIMKKEIQSALEGFKEYLELSESNIETEMIMAKKRLDKYCTDLSESKNEENALLIDSYIKKTVLDFEKFSKSFPGILRYSLIVSLYSFFEISICKISLVIQGKCPFGIDELRGNLLERIKKYFNKIEGIKVNDVNNEWEFISYFAKLRNFLVHYNGEMSKCPEDLLKYLKHKNSVIYFGVEEKFLIIKMNDFTDVGNYFQKIIKIASGFLFFLLDQIEEKQNNGNKPLMLDS